MAFISGRLGLEYWWSDNLLQLETARKSAAMSAGLNALGRLSPFLRPPTGRGMMFGLPCASRAFAERIASGAFARGLLLETCGKRNDVLKFTPPLTILDEEINRGMRILGDAVEAALGEREDSSEAPASELPRSTCNQ
jgi:diaminobutyrate-2-oxoglutarate transaminase